MACFIASDRFARVETIYAYKTVHSRISRGSTDFIVAWSVHLDLEFDLERDLLYCSHDSFDLWDVVQKATSLLVNMDADLANNLRSPVYKHRDRTRIYIALGVQCESSDLREVSHLIPRKDTDLPYVLLVEDLMELSRSQIWKVPCLACLGSYEEVPLDSLEEIYIEA